MVLRLSNEALRIRLSPEEARALLETGSCAETFTHVPRARYEAKLVLCEGSAGLEVSDDGFRCGVTRAKLAAALEERPRRDPVEAFIHGDGFSVVVEVDVFKRERGGT